MLPLFSGASLPSPALALGAFHLETLCRPVGALRPGVDLRQPEYRSGHQRVHGLDRIVAGKHSFRDDARRRAIARQPGRTLDHPASTRSIVLGKWWGAFRPVPKLAVLPGLIAFGVAVANLGLIAGIFYGMLITALVLAYGAVVTSVGLAIAT